MIRKALITIAAMLLVSLPGIAQELEDPAEGKAKLYVFYFGFGMRTSFVRMGASIFVDDQYRGSIGTSEYLGTDVEPGERLVWSFTAGKKHFVRLEAAAGKTYYIQLMPEAKLFQPVPYPRLFDACPNGKGKGRYKKIVKRLGKNAFTLAENPPEKIEKGQREHAAMVEEVLKRWRSDWQHSSKWPVISREAGN